MFQSLVRAYKRSDLFIVFSATLASDLFQSLVRAYKRSDLEEIHERHVCVQFQSLVRAYKRSDLYRRCLPETSSVVSIPRSGLQAFRLKRSLSRSKRAASVSIPRSGLQAFRLQIEVQGILVVSFQSLVRAYKRSDTQYKPRVTGFRFEFQSLVRAYKRSDNDLLATNTLCRCCFNPSFGLTSVPTPSACSMKRNIIKFQSLVRAYKRSDSDFTIICSSFEMFQSLVRAYKRSDSVFDRSNIASPSVSIPRSGLQAFRRIYSLLWQLQSECFNPSFGLTSVPTSASCLSCLFCIYSFNPSFGLTSVPTFMGKEDPYLSICFNPSFGLTSVPTGEGRVIGFKIDLFQSLVRAYKRSDLQ